MIWHHGNMALLGRVHWATTQDGPTHAPARAWSIFHDETSAPPFTLILTDADHPHGKVLDHHPTLSDAQKAANRDRIARLQPETRCCG